MNANSINGQIKLVLFKAPGYITFHTIRNRVAVAAKPTQLYIRLRLFLKKGLVERRFEGGVWHFRLTKHGRELAGVAFEGRSRSVLRAARVAQVTKARAPRAPKKVKAAPRRHMKSVLRHVHKRKVPAAATLLAS